MSLRAKADIAWHLGSQLLNGSRRAKVPEQVANALALFRTAVDTLAPLDEHRRPTR